MTKVLTLATIVLIEAVEQDIDHIARIHWPAVGANVD